MIADCARRIVHVEGGAFEAHGLQTDDWIGQRIEQVLPADAVQVLRPRFDAALGGATQSFEYHTQGRARQYSVQLVPVPAAEGLIGSGAGRWSWPPARSPTRPAWPVCSSWSATSR